MSLRYHEEMNKRSDLTTASVIDVAVTILTARGVLIAARFLDKHQVATDVAIRVLGDVSRRRSPTRTP